ncbi:SSD domain-containing protein [Aphelenchoides fujianensis]|nr:SSD domain-containing protein [Aphelenchoides fujianensis]
MAERPASSGRAFGSPAIRGRSLASAWCSRSLCAVKTATTKKQSDLLAYAPPGARSRAEHAAFQEFFGREGQGVMTYVLIEAKDNQTMLRCWTTSAATSRIHNAALNRSQSFEEFCTGFCSLNEPVRQFYNGFLIQHTQLQSQGFLNPRIRLNYPTTSLFGSASRTRKSQEMAERSEVPVFTNMKDVRMIVFQFRADKDVNWAEEAVFDYEMAIADLYRDHFQSDNIEVLVISPSVVAKEIELGGMSLQPLLVVGFLSMCAFVISTSVLSSLFVGQFDYFKILLAVAACTIPLLSCVTAFGLCFFAGLRFSPLIAITPFLVLAIGVDDAFLVDHSWKRAVRKTQKQAVRGHLGREQRLAMVCAESGPSILLSSTTNILAFLIGATMSTPEIQLFSIVNAAAIFVDMIYSLTFYPAILALCDQSEAKEVEKRADGEWMAAVQQCVHGFLDRFVQFVTTPSVAVLIVTTTLFCLGITAFGASQMTIDLSSDKFFLGNSDADRLKQMFVVPSFTAPTFIVNRPGNLSDSRRLARLEALVEHLEQLPDAIGRESTKYFYRDFKDYLAAFAEMEGEEEHERAFNADELESFFQWPEYSYWRGFLRLSNDTRRPGHVQLEKFFFTTGYAGDRLLDWNQRHAMMDEWRRAVDRFKEFEVVVYYEDALFLDLVDVLPASTVQSAVATLLCVGLVCFLFMGNLSTTLLASFSVLSICCGQIGLLHFFGFTLDPIMAAALQLTIGLSVDIPAHFSYHFHRTQATSEDIGQRLKSTLSSVGFPVLQAGISTILCVVSLLCVPLYMGGVFVLSLALCISLSLLHALVVLPAILTVGSNLKKAVGRRKGRRPVVPLSIADSKLPTNF